MNLSGVCTALVTPFDSEKQIDYAATKKLVDFQLTSGIKNLLLLGSTGESFALSEAEKSEIVQFVKALLPKDVFLLVGAGSNNEKQTIQNIKNAKIWGADACLVTTPFFNRCTQEGIFEFFKEICKKADLPLYIYNIPSRSGVNLEPQTMAALCQFDEICGLKEANGNIDHILNMFDAVGDKIPIFCGNDNLNYLFQCLNAKGTISVASNVFPKKVLEMFDGENALEIHKKLFNFNKLLFCEPNPIPVKYALSRLGIIQNSLRLPLTSLEESHQKMMDAEMQK